MYTTNAVLLFFALNELHQGFYHHVSHQGNILFLIRVCDGCYIGFCWWCVDDVSTDPLVVSKKSSCGNFIKHIDTFMIYQSHDVCVFLWPMDSLEELVLGGNYCSVHVYKI